MDTLTNIVGTVGTAFIILTVSTIIGIVTTVLMVWYTCITTGIKFKDMSKQSIDQARAIGFTILLVATVLFAVNEWLL